MRFLSSGQAKRSWQRAVAAVVCVSFAFGFATPVSFADTTEVVPPTPTLNAPAQGSVVPDGSPVITGWVTSGLLVEVHIDGAFNGWATVQESDSVTDSFYYTPFLPLTPGEHSFHARAKDPETGARSLPTQEIGFLVAEKLPAPTLLEPVVRAGQPLQPLVVGLTYGNTTVEVFVDGVSQGKITVPGDPVKVDDFAMRTVALSEGEEHLVYAVATDTLGRTSAKSDFVSVTVSKPKTAATSDTAQPSEKNTETTPAPQETSTDTTDEAVLGTETNGNTNADDSDDVAQTDEDEDATEDTDDEANTNETAATTDDADDDNDRSALVTWIVVIAVLVIILALRLRGNSGGKMGTDGTARSVFTGDHSSNPTTEKKDEDVPPPPPPPPTSSSY